VLKRKGPDINIGGGKVLNMMKTASRLIGILQ
jgi:hypothetical protein